MEIKSAHIYGFGKWVDFSIDFSGDHLQLVYGENESGKSTLYHFLLFMLFGLSPKERMFFRSKTSSRFGGKLIVLDEIYGEYVIERVEQQSKAEAFCKTADGQLHDEAWLKERLNGMTADIYRSIYGFSADDLNGMERMKEEDLGEVLLGIGFTGASKLHQIEKRLSAKLGELFKPNGKIPEINKELERLEQLQAKIAVHDHEESDYLAKSEQMLDIEKKMELQQKKRKELQKRYLQLENLQQALPALQDYQSATKRLCQMPDVIAFPQDGIKRMTVRKDKILPLKSELTVIEKNRMADCKEAETIREKSRSFPQKQVKAFHHDYLQWQQRQTEISQYEQSIQQNTIALNTIRKDLDIGLSFEDATKMHLPFHIEKTWEQIKSENEKAIIEKENAAKEKRYLDEQQAYLEKQLQDLQAERLSEEKRAALVAEQKAYQEQWHLQTITAESDHTRSEWRHLQEKRSKQSKAYLCLSAVVFLILMVSAIWTKQIGYAIAAAGSVIFGIIQWNWQRNISHSMDKMMHVPSIGKVTVSEEAYQQGKSLLEIDNENLKDADALYEKMKELDIQYVRWKEKERLIQQQMEQISSKMKEQTERYPFLNHISVSSWPSLYHACKNVQRIGEDIEEQKRNMKQLQEMNENFHQRLALFFKKMNWAADLGEIEDKSTEALMRRVEEKELQFQGWQQRLSDLQRSLEKHDAASQALKEEIAVYQSEINELFRIAQVEDEETYYEAAEQAQLHEALIKERQRLRKQFAIYFNDEEWERLAQSLPKQSDLEWEYNQTGNRLEEMEKSMAAYRKEHARIQAQLAQMESVQAHSALFHQSQMHKDKLRELARQWSIIKMAKEMLKETKRNFRDKYMEQVIAQTAFYFRKLTGGTYESVIAPSENQPFSVESFEKNTYTVGELSKGTMDQLYVSLRLAISEVISGENRLPFLIDDGFVHFDMARNERMLEILNGMAKDRQIILFSCRKNPGEINDGKVTELPFPIRI